MGAGGAWEGGEVGGGVLEGGDVMLRKIGYDRDSMGLVDSRLLGTVDDSVFARTARRGCCLYICTTWFYGMRLPCTRRP